MTDLITYFSASPRADEIPDVIPSPFANMPHPLAMRAAHMLQQRLSEGDSEPSNSGKMFGVLVIRDRDDRIGFLSAFSGMFNGKWELPGFVPQIFEMAGENSSLAFGNTELEDLTAQIENLEKSPERAELADEIAQLQQQRNRELADLKQRHKKAKALRKTKRQVLTDLSDPDQQAEMRALALASQHHKREATNATQTWNERLQAVQLQLDALEQQIVKIREQRTERSRQLHREFFESYRLVNALQEQQPITRFFDSTPPAGAGDCAGPKLIQHAHLHHLQPLALAEFWWGPSPSTGIRHHGHFYPACRGKCRPILPFMLRGLEFEPEPDHGLGIDSSEPQVVFEDDSMLVVNKPAGLMSAPGKYVKDCAINRLIQRHPKCPEMRLVHRLDMATSGLLLVAKTLSANKFLQRQFIQRSVEKRYEAILSKPLSLEQAEGDIELPLIVDLDDTPRQMVSLEYGKPAKTHWQVIARDNETTRVWFYPLTGRTHQLRVHASHKDGLNAAIVGDELYGKPAERLMLHAQRLCFNHPITRERMEFELPAPF